MKFGLATIIPWSLVLVLGTASVSEHAISLFHSQEVVDNNSDEPEPEPDNEEEIKAKAIAAALSKVHEEFVKIESEEDKVIIYKLFSGSAEYLNNSVSLEDTSQFDPILGRAQTSYGWNRESYPDFTQSVSDYLVVVGYDESRKLDTQEAREWFQGVFESLAEATR